MPELPEVEVTRLGLLKRIKGKTCTGVTVRERRFRKEVPENFGALLKGRRLLDIHRRGKYLLWEFDKGALLSHLGMSGVLRVYDCPGPAIEKHDHIDISFGDVVVRYHDPRRFGFITWKESLAELYKMNELSKLGVEPLEEEFTAKYLKSALSKCQLSIKEALLSGKFVVGVGNIYCSESLFRAGINPQTEAGKVSLKRLEKLVDSIKDVLTESIAQGGSTLKDFVSAEGKSGYFTINAFVYGRSGQPCKKCGTKIKKIIQGQRTTYYCPNCQKR